jgi:hypothetical protein
MELLISLAMKFWMWSILILVVIAGFIINLFDKKKPKCHNFSYTKMPVMRPIPSWSAFNGWIGTRLCL